MAIKKSSSSGIPFGNNAGRPANPGLGQLYSNGEAQRLELYTPGGWNNIVQEVPGVSSISGTYIESVNENTILIYGTNFATGAIAYAIGADSVPVAAISTTYNSLVQLTAVFTGLSPANEPYDIKVQNPSNLFGQLPDALFINNKPSWQTAAGSLGTFNEQVSVSVSAIATDQESNTITYSLVSGSFLPSGLTLNSETGLISGTLPDIATDTTYTFTINASDGINASVARQFSITSKYMIPTEYLVVAGGGGGGGITVGGGGGAGGMLTGTSLLPTTGSVSVSVGQGGTGVLIGGTDATNGVNSTLQFSGFSTLTAIGGGAGGNYSGGNQPGASRSAGSAGGSGGGGGDANRSGGAGTPGQGNAGGPSGSNWGGGGGGGAGAVGGTGIPTKGGSGGNGLQSSITGSTLYYAGGGGGCSDSAGGDAGLGGGGLGGGNSPSRTPTAGAVNTGGGGGAARDFPSGGAAANGGSGVVIIAYPNTFPALTSTTGNLTYDQPTRSGYRVYRFTAGTGTITY